MVKLDLEFVGNWRFSLKKGIEDRKKAAEKSRIEYMKKAAEGFSITEWFASAGDFAENEPIVFGRLVLSGPKPPERKR